MNKRLILKLWSLGVGGMDACTGLLLVFAPTLVLPLLGIAPPSGEGLVFVSWIGVFVMSVGLSYGLALGGNASRGEAAWISTALARTLVAVFLTIKCLGGSLPAAWLIVAASDASVAAGQWVILRLGWWREVRG